MSNVRPDIDLGALSRTPTAVAPPPRRWLRIVVPILILGTFAAILFTSLGDVFRSAVEVTVIRPRPAASSGGASASSVAFQAAGWVEPNPYPTLVTALTSGVISEVLVLESDAVKAGDPVAKLVDADARLALEGAEAALARASAERAKAAVELTNADESFRAALDVTEADATAKADLDGKKSESVFRAAAVVQGEAQFRIAQEELAVQQELVRASAAGPRAVEIAVAKVDEARGNLEALRGSAAAASAEVKKAEARLARTSADRQLRLSDRLRLESAKTGAALAEAAVREATVARDVAALRLERTVVRAPAAGIVLERLVAPGTPVGATDGGGAPVCSLFDPRSVRVRVDVPLSEIGKVRPGQRAEIASEARAGRPYSGDVIRIVQKADIQKVTLQVQVRIDDSDALLRPEMLCQVRFLADAASSQASRGADAPVDRVLVPEKLVLGGNAVWVVDPIGHSARRRTIEVGGRNGEWVEVRSGLNLTDKLIDEGRNQVSEGARIRVRGGE